jgi:hypothetical protein
MPPKYTPNTPTTAENTGGAGNGNFKNLNKIPTTNPASMPLKFLSFSYPHYKY